MVISEKTDLINRLGELSQEKDLLELSGHDTGQAIAEIESEIDEIETHLGFLKEGE